MRKSDFLMLEALKSAPHLKDNDVDRVDTRDLVGNLITLTVSLVGGVGDPLNSSCHKGLFFMRVVHLQTLQFLHR
jgi:hypothetical protein